MMGLKLPVGVCRIMLVASGDIKIHVSLPDARVSKILQRAGYGFLTSDDGREIYSHKNSVIRQRSGI